MVHWGQQLLFLMPVMATFHSWSSFKFLQQDQLCNNLSQSQPLPAATVTFLLQHSQHWSSNTKMANSRSPGKHTQSPKYLQGRRVYWILYTEICCFLQCTILYPMQKQKLWSTLHAHLKQQQRHCHCCYNGSYMLNSLWEGERERRGCVTSVHGKRVLEVVDVSTYWANEGSKFQGRPWDA